MTGELCVNNIDLNTANPTGLVWSIANNNDTGYVCYILRLRDIVGFSPSDRALVILIDGQWSIEIWSAAEYNWWQHKTTYDDLETAKAVATALLAMESK